MPDDRLTPDQARVRFGELLGIARTHREFEAPEGLWRPVFDAKLKLEGYRLYPAPKREAKKVVWRPKGKR